MLQTYCVDGIVADSACTATAIFTGEKTRLGVIGANSNVRPGNCTSMQNNTIPSILEHFVDEGLYML